MDVGRDAYMYVCMSLSVCVYKCMYSMSGLSGQSDM